jgi:hypothetical protein
MLECGLSIWVTYRLGSRDKIPRLKRDQRTGHAGLGAIKEEAHAQGFGALHCDQAHLSTDVIGIFKQRDLGFVEIGIAFQAGDPFFERFSEAWADFETFIQGGVFQHGNHLLAGILGRKIFSIRSQVFPDAPDINE